jgi:hypothetical protein
MGFAGMPHISGQEEWKYAGPRPNMYQVEHDQMFASIRKGEPINNGLRLAYTSMTAIMGRMAAYTGENVTWEQALNSEEHLVPEKMDWEMNLPVQPIALPGLNKLV